MNFHSYKPISEAIFPFADPAVQSLPLNLKARLWHEEEWKVSGRPYCKVYPGMALELAAADLGAVPVSEFQMPYEHIEIATPQDGYWKGAILLSLMNGKGLGLLAQYPGGPADVAFSQFPLDRGDTLGACYAYIAREADGDMPGEEVAYRNACWAMAISVAMFMADRHQLILPDLEPRTLPRARRDDGRKAKGKLPPRPVALTLGREIELPRPVRADDGAPVGAGPAHLLKNAHYRRGHWKMQPCGEGMRDRKRIYVRATIVRPDLPMPARGPGYFIPDRREAAHGHAAL